jgi:dUTP pyrophosphatase
MSQTDQPTAPVMNAVRVREGGVLPVRAHHDDAGLDLCSHVDVSLEPGARALVPTGVAVAVPDGHVGLVCARSGLAARHGIGLVNAPGVIDSGYRGELQVVLHNCDPAQAFTVRAGDRIAQLVVVPVALAQVAEVAALDDGSRAERGFGSTGGFEHTAVEVGTT